MGQMPMLVPGGRNQQLWMNCLDVNGIRRGLCRGLCLDGPPWQHQLPAPLVSCKAVVSLARALARAPRGNIEGTPSPATHLGLWAALGLVELPQWRRRGCEPDAGQR